MTRRILSCVFCIFVLAAAVQAQEEAEKVYQTLSPQVVGLRNVEGSGSGILLDKNGLILTNAHVITSPLPYEVVVDEYDGDEKTQYIFKKSEIIGVHPKYDLALVKIDPKEHRIKLQAATLAEEKARPGQRVYVIGNPGGGGQILEKSISSGMLSASDRVFEGLSYYQVSAPINPGNSGGPLVNKDSEVIGLVTWKLTDVENIGFAIPLNEFKTDVFVPLKDRATDPDQAMELIKHAEEMDDQAVAARDVGDTYSYEMFNSMVLALYAQALTYDPSNSALYYNVGIAHARFKNHDVAFAYLLRANQLRPWSARENTDYYHELGLSLVKTGREKDALIIWKEGITKYPKLGGRVWEDLAIYAINNDDPVNAAYYAKMAIEAGECRFDVVQSIVRQAEGKMNEEQKKEFQKLDLNLKRDMLERREEADKLKAKGDDWITEECKEWMTNQGGVQKASAKKVKDDLWSGNEKTSNRKEKKKDEDVSEDEEAERWIESKLNLAKNYKNARMFSKAKKVLNEIIEEYPDAKDTKKARKMLDEIEAK